MKSITATKVTAFIVAALTFAVPAISFAATSTVTQLPSATASSTAQELSSELSSISSQLSSDIIASSTAIISLSPGQSITQASSSAPLSGTPNGLLKISLPAFGYVKPDMSAKVQQPVINLAEVTFQYMPCLAAAPSVCVSASSTAYPAMTSDLASGQMTGYLHYLVTLTNLSTTTATLQIMDTSFLTNLQNQVNAIATKVNALLGN